MTPGRGYAGQGGGLGNFTGDVNNGNVDYTLFYTPDIPGNTSPNTPFNLVGNPYPSGVSCASLVTANPDISGALYFWDDDNSGGTGYSYTDYAVWNGTGSLGTGSGSQGPPNGVISSGQGFKVKAISPGAVLNFNNTMRVANTTQFFRVNGDDSRLWFSVEGNNHFNQILIGILDDATDGEDRLYDATKLRGNADISLAVTEDGKDYCIYAFPPPSVDKTVPLHVHTSSAGTYTFKANTMENFQYEDVYFNDALLGTEVLLAEGTEIPVSLDAGEHGGRFYLNFRPEGSLVGVRENQSFDVNIYSYQDELYVGSNSTRVQSSDLELFDMNGKLVLGESGIGLSSSVTRFSLSGLAKGVYMVRLTVGKEQFNSKVVKF
jgi:hypothetical protein